MILRTHELITKSLFVHVCVRMFKVKHEVITSIDASISQQHNTSNSNNKKYKQNLYIYNIFLSMPRIASSIPSVPGRHWGIHKNPQLRMQFAIQCMCTQIRTHQIRESDPLSSTTATTSSTNFIFNPRALEIMGFESWRKMIWKADNAHTVLR